MAARKPFSGHRKRPLRAALDGCTRAFIEQLDRRILFAALAGDCTLDGKVNSADFNILAANFLSVSNATWAQGDFNGDQHVDSLDFNALVSNYGAKAAPDTPATPSAEAISDSQVNITWTDVDTETGFQIDRSPDGLTNWAIAGSVGKNILTFQDSGRNEATRWYYRVSAINSVGVSTPSAAASAVTWIASPVGLSAAAQSPSIAQLSWSNASSVASVISVDRSVDNMSWTPLTATLPANTTSYTDTGRSEDISYYYRVRSLGASAPPSNYAATSVRMPLASPGTPAVASIGAAADAYVQDGAPATTNYGTATSLYAKTYNIGSNRRCFFRFDLSGLGANLDTATLSLYGTNGGSAPIPIQVYAVPDVQWSETGITWNNQPTYGAVPLDTATFAGSTSGWYTWDLTEYARTLKNAGENLMSVAVISPTSTQPIVAVNSRESSANKPSLSFTLTGPSARAISSSRVDISWVDQSAKETGYVVERSSDGEIFTAVGTTGPNVNGYSDTSALEGRTYSYRVRAFNSGNTSGYLATAVAQTNPASPASAAFQSNGSAGLAINWQDLSVGETGTVIERSSNNATFVVVGTVGQDITSFTDPQPLEGTSYYRVRSWNGGGWSGYSATLTVNGTYPTAPTQLTATFPTTTSVQLSWSDRSTIETGYVVERSTDKQNWTALTSSLPANSTTYLDNSGLTPYLPYYYRVRAAAASGPGAASDVLVADRLDPIQQTMLGSVYSLDYVLATGASYETRALAQRALYTLTMGEDARSEEKAKSYLAGVWAVQDMNPASSRYGRVPWNDDNWYDANAIEFTMNHFTAAYLGHLARLEPGYLDSVVAGYTVRQHLQAGLSAVLSHSVSVNYTNIYLMRAANTVLLGEILGDANAIAQGYGFLGTWLADTKAAGINEFDSPGYAAVNLTTLQRLYTHTSSDKTRSRARSILDLLYTDLAANAFTPRGELAGAHSRDYDFLDGVDSINAWYFMQGLTPTLQGNGADLYGATRDGTYQPTSAQLPIAGQSTRIVKQKWGTTAGQDKYTYITPGFAIGSTSAFYANHDKQITASLSSSKAMPQLSIVEDSFDSPWGTVTVVDSGGHDKPFHVKNSLAAVQEKGTVLAVANLGPQFTASPTTTYTSLATNLIFPSNADKLYLNGTEITDRATTINTTLNSVLGVREGNTVIAYRMFLLNGTGGYTPTSAIKFDGPAGANAGRFVAYHYLGSARTLSGDCRVGYMISAQSCATDAEANAFLLSVQNAPITLTTSGNKTKATLVLGSTTLASELDVSTELPTLRQVNGINYVADRFTVSDGTTTHDFAASLLDSLDLSPMLVEGSAFNDANANGLWDAGEAHLPGRTVYLDADDNGALDPARSVNVSSNASKQIVDAATSTATLNVSGLAAIAGVRVAINVQHPNVGDLVITLISPTGTRVRLANRMGGTGDNFGTFSGSVPGSYVPGIWTCFDDAAPTAIADGTAPYNVGAAGGLALYRPDQVLAALNGQSPNGTWKLEVVDAASGNSGYLNGWRLMLNVAPEQSVQTDADGRYSFPAFPAGTGGSGRFRIAKASAETITAPASGSLLLNLSASLGYPKSDFGIYNDPTLTDVLTLSADATSVPVNRPVQVTALLQDKNGMVLSNPIILTTSLGSIDASGLLFSDVPGIATVTAVSGIYRATTQITFGPVPLPVADYAADETGGTTLSDASGNSLNGTLTSTGVTFGSGFTGGGLAFSGGTGSVNLGQPAVLNYSGQVAFSAWVKPVFSASSGLQYILGRAYSSSGPAAETALRLYNNTYQVGSWNGVSQYVSAPIPEEDLNSWVHLIGSYDGTGWRLYRNGALLASNTSTLGLIGNYNKNWRIGSAESTGLTRFFNGSIDDVRIFNVGLSNQEALWLYQSSLAPTITSQASASVSGSVATLNVLAADNALSVSGESSLSYQWSVVGTAPGSVSFAANDSNAAKSTSAVFSTSGVYQLRVLAVSPTGFAAASYLSVSIPAASPIVQSEARPLFAESPILGLPEATGLDGEDVLQLV